jgi:hypothetical protein
MSTGLSAAACAQHAAARRLIVTPSPVQVIPPDFEPMFGALADHTRRDIVRRAI